MSAAIKRGALIVLEGCDRTGKSTQCKQLVQSLLADGRPAKYMNFPNRSTESGKMINAFLTNQSEFAPETIHLLFTINRWECKKSMEQLIREGTTLVVDRYSYSGIAYSMAKGLQQDWCCSAEANLLRPDLVLLLTLSETAQAERGGFGNERYETPEIQKKVAANFELLFDNGYWRRVDAGKSIVDLHTELLALTKDTITAIEETEIQLLEVGGNIRTIN